MHKDAITAANHWIHLKVASFVTMSRGHREISARYSLLEEKYFLLKQRARIRRIVNYIFGVDTPKEYQDKIDASELKALECECLAVQNDLFRRKLIRTLHAMAQTTTQPT